MSLSSELLAYFMQATMTVCSDLHFYTICQMFAVQIIFFRSKNTNLTRNPLQFFTHNIFVPHLVSLEQY